MKPTSFVRVLLIVIVIVGVLGATGPNSTAASFEDEQFVTGNVTADVGFSTNPGNGNGGGNGNGNGYSESELVSFDNTSTNLVIPSNIDKIHTKNGPVSIRAASITSEADIRSDSGDVTLESTSGSTNLVGSSVRAKNGDVTIHSTGHLDLAQTSIRADTGDVDIRAQSIDASGAYIRSKNGEVELTTTGNGDSLIAPNSEIDAQSNIRFRSEGDMTFDRGKISSKNGAITADLGSGCWTLSVAGTTIENIDNTLVYDSDCTSVNGAPNGATST